MFPPSMLPSNTQKRFHLNAVTALPDFNQLLLDFLNIIDS